MQFCNQRFDAAAPSHYKTRTVFADIKDSLRELYLSDSRPWLIGFSGGKDSTMVASLIYEVVQSLDRAQRTKPIAIVCTDTRVEIPAIVDMIEGTLGKMQRNSTAEGMNIDKATSRLP